MKNSNAIKTEYANIDNFKIAYRKRGNGIPIILANRFRGTLDTWDPLFLDLLAENNTVITFDYSGVGYSEGELPMDIKKIASQIIELADYLKIDKFFVLGWSYGGWVAQYVTFMNLSRVLKTVIIGSNPIGKNEVPLEPLFLKHALKPINDLEDEIIIFYEPKSVKSRKAAKESRSRIHSNIDISKIPSSEEEFKRYFAVAPSVVEDKENFREKYTTLQTPILVISSDHDISYATENWFPLLKNAPTIQHIILPDSGHAMHFQYPKLSTEYINIFLKN
ncbi:alpha/beta hydrolase [Polaribacter reichenbachii]|mgnify:CR=1 FL=1|uniref:Alpha/beta hydrolase n=1 Tax=Polaribacter reichenbachii TaxID=996801 RepID=A0A1B8U2R0_9FLAO|nr:alpha/beta hydrolase [Polaribacter reichenbachii]APZ47382.1 alpha/beta hydrolase [Polaribacter reichenbachii]AUC18023.1 alpha/beta hydrolase [Polaribacter reichenbachii]OBY66069.1 alpha/beta hydrolase [Polaribacter reichenbachii]|tara:strand:- start:46 stop:879 length:834 start_codon:yes stop_codon:yes gene_type:complete